jgi:heterodisulfide reductase subunit C
LFQQAFLDNIRRNGRLDEIELIAEFKLRALPHERSLGFLFKDAGLAPQLLKRQKLHLRGEKVKDRAVVRRIFERCAARRPEAIDRALGVSGAPGRRADGQRG